jgi:hypothetical protein
VPDPIKIPTSWRPSSGQGSVVLIGNVPIVTNTGVRLVTTTSHLPIMTNPTVTKPKNPTVWSQTG